MFCYPSDFYYCTIEARHLLHYETYGLIDREARACFITSIRPITYLTEYWEPSSAISVLSTFGGSYSSSSKTQEKQ